MKQRNWRELITEEVKQVYQPAGIGARLGFGDRPALLVIDMQLAQIGDKPERCSIRSRTILLSAGEAGWATLEKIKEILEASRAASIPLIYCSIIP